MRTKSNEFDSSCIKKKKNHAKIIILISYINAISMGPRSWAFAPRKIEYSIVNCDTHLYIKEVGKYHLNHKLYSFYKKYFEL